MTESPRGNPLRRLVERYTRSPRTLRGRINELHLKVDHLSETLNRLVERHKQDEKWRGIFRRQMNSVIRNLYLSDGDIPAPHALAAKRFRLRSQNEEDGIVLALLKAGGLKTRRFVEIGSGGTGGNSAMLAAELGWEGLMLDSSHRGIDQVRALFAANPRVSAVRAVVSPENINKILSKNGFAGEVDLLSIDIDSIDYWILEALKVCQPRVLVMEYNALFGPTLALTLPNAPKPEKSPKGYSGASLAALEKLARRKGYRLVVCEEAGINAFFLREDVAPAIPGLTSEQAWRPWVDKFDVTGLRRKEIDIFGVIRQAGLPLVEV